MNYELTEQTKEIKNGNQPDSTISIVYRIRALVDLPYHNVKAGDFGGYIESFSNLTDNGWVGDDAIVMDNAVVKNNARLSNTSVMRGCAILCDDAVVKDDCDIMDRTVISSNVQVCGDSETYGNAILDTKDAVYTNISCYGGRAIIFHTFPTNLVRSIKQDIKNKLLEKISSIDGMSEEECSKLLNELSGVDSEVTTEA